ncbi:hypothetical protein TanjilG_21634 [Lupinus angustifolius]|uniref:Nucleobase-ascorbate transporter 2 n=1 Tax=Lupinus angustifolius TaxID=3871 RepID=A0A4P1QUK8_LUPAN|nr:hypothetical protein TanjilG_21634 [Lupinus angustifolius]
MAAPKIEEISHQPMDQLQGLEYCIDSDPSWVESIALGFQHYILALGTAVMIPSFLVPLMGGNDRFLSTMRAVQGAMIVASSIQIILGFSQLWAICSRFFSPLGMVPVIALVGFGLFDRGIKIPYPLEWGAPTFDAGHSFGMMAAVLVSLIEYHDRENVGLLGSTRVGSRRVIQISAGFMIFFSMLASVGLSFLQFTNMNSLRNLFITGIALFLGFSVPEYFREYTSKALHGPTHTRAGWFNDFLNTIFFSSPSVALIVAVFLDNTLEYKDSTKDRGMPWWANFRTFKGDTRNEEFYTLPFNLNHYFPPS